MAALADECILNRQEQGHYKDQRSVNKNEGFPGSESGASPDSEGLKNQMIAKDRKPLKEVR